MFLPRTPAIATWLYPKRLWRMPHAGDKALYLTFDDGPTPGVTDWVMEMLAEYGGKGTFFVVGEQAQRHPELLRKVVEAGHTVGNHSQTHPNGWKTPSETYLKDVAHGARSIEELLPEGQALELFRPPYGRLRWRDARKLESKVVMWDVVAGDWQAERSKEEVLGNVIRNARLGSIVVFHDSKKAEGHLRHALPKVLAHFAQQGYQFKCL